MTLVHNRKAGIDIRVTKSNQRRLQRAEATQHRKTLLGIIAVSLQMPVRQPPQQVAFIRVDRFPLDKNFSQRLRLILQPDLHARNQIFPRNAVVLQGEESKQQFTIC